MQLLRMLAVVGLSLAAEAACGQAELYTKHDSLQQTMAATRARFQAWQASQRDAWSAVHVGGWHSAAIESGQRLDGERITQDGIEKGAPSKPPQPAWRACPADDSKQPILATPPPDFLYATIIADKPVELTIELSRHEGFGGFAYRPPPSQAGVRPTDALVWVNGRRLPLCDRMAGYGRVPVAKRRGWHDAVLIDVPLVRGENRLLVALGKGSQRAWFNAVRLVPDPLPALWSMIENDFPPAENRLLASIPYQWFDTADGWFAEAAAPRLGRQFLATAVEELGPDGATIRGSADKLAAAQTSSSDPRWLDLCVTAAELAEPYTTSMRSRQPSRNCTRRMPNNITASRYWPARPTCAGSFAARPPRVWTRPPSRPSGCSARFASFSASPWSRKIRCYEAKSCCSSSAIPTTRTITTMSSLPDSASSAAIFACCRWPTARCGKSPHNSRRAFSIATTSLSMPSGSFSTTSRASPRAFVFTKSASMAPACGN